MHSHDIHLQRQEFLRKLRVQRCKGRGAGWFLAATGAVLAYNYCSFPGENKRTYNQPCPIFGNQNNTTDSIVDNRKKKKKLENEKPLVLEIIDDIYEEEKLSEESIKDIKKPTTLPFFKIFTGDTPPDSFTEKHVVECELEQDTTDNFTHPANLIVDNNTEITQDPNYSAPKFTEIYKMTPKEVNQLYPPTEAHYRDNTAEHRYRLACAFMGGLIVKITHSLLLHIHTFHKVSLVEIFSQ